MDVSTLVYDVTKPFSYHITIFPLRNAFILVADGVNKQGGDMFTTFREAARASVKFLPGQSVEVLNRSKSTTKSMQASRTAVRVFCVLDLTALQRGITQTTQTSSVSWTKERCKLYDQNSESIRTLQTTLPMWQKLLPGLAITYLRCAVKVTQKRFRRATANLHGDDFIEVFTTHEEVAVCLELDHLCDKVELYFKSLKSFVECNCVIPESDPSDEDVRERQNFLETLASCRKLLHHFNKRLPILYVVNKNLRNKLQSAWHEDIDKAQNWTLQGIDTQNVVKDTHFVDYEEATTKEIIENINALNGVTTVSDDLYKSIAQSQLSTIASADVLCVTISKIRHPLLNAFGHEKDKPAETFSGRRPLQNSDEAGKTSEPKERTQLVRNIHLQVDLFCLWSSILAADEYLEAKLIDTDKDSTLLQMTISDEWYEDLFTDLVVPDFVMNAACVEKNHKLATASSLVMQRYAENASLP